MRYSVRVLTNVPYMQQPGASCIFLGITYYIEGEEYIQAQWVTIKTLDGLISNGLFRDATEITIRE